MGVGNDPRYNKSRCFEPFPFPFSTHAQQHRIRELGEQLDAHRKRQQAAHPGLTMTGMYNVLEKLRSGEPLTDKEKMIHEQGLVSVLKQIHDELDAAVFDAYGWPVTLTDEEILERLVALNAERAREEERGVIRWLRPEFQNAAGGGAAQQQLAIPDSQADEAEETVAAKPAAKVEGQKLPWPKSLAEQAQALRAAVVAEVRPVTPADLARRFQRAPVARVTDLLETLCSLGQAHHTPDGRYTT